MPPELRSCIVGPVGAMITSPLLSYIGHVEFVAMLLLVAFAALLANSTFQVVQIDRFAEGFLIELVLPVLLVLAAKLSWQNGKPLVAIIAQRTKIAYAHVWRNLTLISSWGPVRRSTKEHDQGASLPGMDSQEPPVA
jgi:hypothetical protein